MAVLIKGMEMPKEDTLMILSPDGTVTFMDNETAVAVEVPEPHWRLIDADALPYLDIEWEDIVNAPTVIEAKVSEEELQREYEANVEYAQYCERYEPTYDPDTGAM